MPPFVVETVRICPNCHGNKSFFLYLYSSPLRRYSKPSYGQKGESYGMLSRERGIDAA